MYCGYEHFISTFTTEVANVFVKGDVLLHTNNDELSVKMHCGEDQLLLGLVASIIPHFIYSW